MLPTTELIHAVDLTLPNLSPELVGLRIAHLTDLHVTRPKLRRRHEQIIRHLRRLRLDMVIFTGDYISAPGQEEAGLEVMKAICSDLRPRLGMFGVFGNHDTARLRQCFSTLPVRWLFDEVCHVPGLPIEMMGFGEDIARGPDALRCILSQPDGLGAKRDDRLRLLLCHRHAALPTAADLGVDLMFSGHTHGGQCRLPDGTALRNSSDYPLRLTSGMLRHRDTICVISRGLGEVTLPLRLFCPPHLPLYTLRRGPIPGRRTDGIRNIRPW